MDYPEELYNHLASTGAGKPAIRIKKSIPEERDADLVDHPPHYTSGGIETIDYMRAKSTPEEFRGHLRLTTLKYLSRAGLKDDTLQDLEKAAWYLNELIRSVKHLQEELNAKK